MSSTGPGGGGKIPVNPNYVVDSDPSKVTLRNYEGEMFDYPNPTSIPESEMKALQEKALCVPADGC